MKTVEQYLRELRESKKDKPQQVKEALQIYIDLWEKVIGKRVVDSEDDIETALSKIDKQGGLYEAAGE